mmetsp:Transcript_92638/g.288348  ORF Transcript_92638/g.288348 Transcript_92638/m.288348 type:complete len:293 (+) Transcript_92638:847-1725(+)
MTLSGSFRHGLPRPEAKTRMKRLRSRMPKQWQLQWDHSPQEASSQSLSSTQGGSSEHTANSSRTPLTGRPQVGCTSTSRRRERKPLEQVAEQPDHCIHWPQTPSMHASSQDCVLQGATWLLSSGGQSWPPFSGATATARLRCLEPPPQEQLQADQSYQSLHLQSTMLQRCSTQGTSSSRGPSQPRPSLAARDFTLRVRVLEPLPHFAEQSDHSSQCESTQSSGTDCWQGPVLQVAVSFSTALLHLPPSLLGLSSCRALTVWPPMHVLSHSLQDVQSVSVQSTGAAWGQPSVS